MSVLQPQLLWAQRKDKLYLTVDLQDCESPEIKVSNEGEAGKFEFRGTAQDHQYELTVQLFAEVDAENVQISNTARKVFLMVPKKEEGDHWPRLTKEKAKHTHIQVDWAKYIEQDDEEAGDDTYKPEGMGDLDMGAMGGMGGMGGMPGMGGMGGMGGMPGMGGEGGMNMADLQAMMAQNAAGGAAPDMGDAGDDSDDEDLPDLED